MGNGSELRQTRRWNKTWTDHESGATVSVALDIDEVRVQRFRQLNDTQHVSYAMKAVAGANPEIESLVEQIRGQYEHICGTKAGPTRHFARFITGLMTQIPYEFDDRSIGFVEYAKFPLELLYDDEGDCECKSILLASLFRVAGFTVSILHVIAGPDPEEDGHAAVGLVLPEEPEDDVIELDGVRYLYCEAVAGGSVGRCAFPFAVILQQNPYCEVLPASYSWDGASPAGWQCATCGVIVSPWRERCDGCGCLAPCSDADARSELACDWTLTLERFLAWINEVRSAPHFEIENTIRSLRASSLWAQVPPGNRAFLESSITGVDRNVPEYGRRIEGCRRHLLKAWPHVAASIFSVGQGDYSGARGTPIYVSMQKLGVSVHEMDKATLLEFVNKVLLDTTVKRIKGFSGGSRRAISIMLPKCSDDAYFAEKRAGLENILVKVVIPQVFALLAREAEARPECHLAARDMGPRCPCGEDSSPQSDADVLEEVDDVSE